MVNVARIPCKCDAVHAANNPREMHIFMLSFICKKQIHLFKTVLGRCVSKLDISIQNCIIRNASVHTERYPRPITVLHTNNELLTFSEKLRIDEEDAVLWLTHASFFKRRFKKTNTKKNKKNCQCFLQEQNSVASHYPVVLQCAIGTRHQSVPTRRSKANLSVLRVYQTQHHTDPSNEAVFNTSDPAAANARNKFTDAPCRHPRNT